LVCKDKAMYLLKFAGLTKIQLKNEMRSKAAKQWKKLSNKKNEKIKPSTFRWLRQVEINNFLKLSWISTKLGQKLDYDQKIVSRIKFWKKKSIFSIFVEPSPLVEKARHSDPTFH
ncbi:hypothetical protein AM593_06757, partial [Mytilus galloprovincialis]